MIYVKPYWYLLALSERGVVEGVGVKNNPVVVQYYAEAGHPEIKQDSVSWCAAWMGSILVRSELEPSWSLLARSYLKWGARLEKPIQGCIIVLKRGTSSWQGHVGFWHKNNYMLGANQKDMISIAPYNPRNVLGYRWPVERLKKL